MALLLASSEFMALFSYIVGAADARDRPPPALAQARTSARDAMGLELSRAPGACGFGFWPWSWLGYEPIADALWCHRNGSADVPVVAPSRDGLAMAACSSPSLAGPCACPDVLAPGMNNSTAEPYQAPEI